MKIMVLAAAIWLMSSMAFAAEPIVKVEPLPSSAELELYEDSEGLFALKVLEYYKAAISLEAQLKMMDLEPTNRLAAPTIDELQDMDLRTLKRYYSQALGIMKQVEAAPDGLYNKKIDELRTKLEKTYSDNFLLKEQMFTQNLDLLSLNFYKYHYKAMIHQTDSLRRLIDSSYYDYMNKLWQHDNEMRNIYENCNSCVPILALSLSGNFWDFGDDRVSTDISPGVMLNFNPSPVVGLGNLIDIFAEYNYPLLKAKSNSAASDADALEYKTDFFSTGLNLNVPLSQIFEIKKFSLGMKAGYGFFWGSTRMPNSGMPSADWQGQVLRLELNAANYNRYFFPVGVFIAYNFYNFSKELAFPNYGGNINLGKPWINNLQLGLKFSLWRSHAAFQQ